jgi:cell wall-associated NlpC family hydrolase
VRETAIKVAWSFLGTPYRWGGDDPTGFDCSGFCIEILKSVGKLPRRGDWTAAMLFDKFSRSVGPGPGRLVFWKNNRGRIIHVEFCLDATLSIGASGGGSRTQTPGDAARQNAYVKIRPFASRPGLAGFVDPFTPNDIEGVAV